MLSSSIRRVTWAPPVPILGFSRPSSQALAVSNVRQRRYSSSSSSKSSDGSRKVDASQTPAKASRRKGRDGNGRNGSSKSNQNAAFSNIPSVPSTQHRQPHDVHVASFFSLHRPISVTTTVPPQSNLEIFDSIFSSKKPPKQAHQDVMYTLSNAVQSMESAAHQHAEQDGSLHFDSDGSQFDAMNVADVKVSVQDMARQFLPFHPPPAPVPLDESKEAHEAAEPAEEPSKGTSSYSTVLTIHESTHPDGRKTYEAHTTPFVRSGDLEGPGATESDMTGPRPGATYIERLRHNRMQAISTKRRRRIKMKKHKWKKRLRLTRSIRQKLDKN